MASFKSIPVEVVLEIVKHILDEDLTLPGVGENAAWIIPPDSQITWTRSQRPARTTRFKVMVNRFSSKIVDRIKQSGQETALSQLDPSYRGLKALRITNRFFNEICRPFLYRELNLLSDMTPIKRDLMNDTFNPPIWPLVQSISIYMDPTEVVDDADFTTQSVNVASILGECENLTSLALYYRHADVQTEPIERAVISLLTSGRLSSLGVYSSNLLRDLSGRDLDTGRVAGVIHLLEGIARSETAQQTLRVLDIAADCIPTETFDLIRSNFTSLTSLTLRRLVQYPWYVGRIWDADQQPKWHPYPNLTRLQLGNLEPGHSSHIPHLVRHFTALKELKISACGTDGNFVRSSRRPGWSQLPEALCNNHPTLTSFHVEHMDDWEIYELGVIPTTVLIVTTVKKDHLLVPLRKDAEIFPGLRVLRLAPLPTNRGIEPAGSATAGINVDSSIQAVCHERSIELRRDAVSYLTCPCNCEEGY